MKSITVIPAYGADYSSEASVCAAWLRGKDFQVQDIGSPHRGSYLSKNEAPILLEDGYQAVKVRYKRQEECCFIPLS